MRYINENLPSDSKILFFFMGKRGYYCDREYVPESQSQLLRFIQEGKTPEDIFNEYRSMKATHLLVHRDLFVKWANEVFNADQIQTLNAFTRHYLDMQFSANGVDLLVFKASGVNISIPEDRKD